MTVHFDSLQLRRVIVLQQTQQLNPQRYGLSDAQSFRATLARQLQPG